jgi:allophanate hydrolase subunit 2
MPWRHDSGPIRLLAGPQSDHFPEASCAALCAEDYVIAADSDRMGLRLIGASLRHNDKGAEILTDGVIPGVIQVPASGQPILLLADAQSSGGYAKIAVVISADLPRLAHFRPGDRISFAWTDRSAARRALTELDRRFLLWREGIGRASGQIDATALYNANLVSGVTDGEDR